MQNDNENGNLNSLKLSITTLKKEKKWIIINQIGTVVLETIVNITKMTI